MRNPTLRFFCPALRLLSCQRWDVVQPRCAPPSPPVRSRTPFDALPRAAVNRILRALPVDTRLRCAEVCANFYVMLGEYRKMWTRVDLSPRSGVRAPSDALLRAAAARACGKLRALDVSDCGAHISLQALYDVWGADHSDMRDFDMRKLRLSGCCCTFEPGFLHDVNDGDDLLCSTEDVPSTQQRLDLWGVFKADAYQQLEVLEIDVACEDVEQACALLRGAPALLRVPRLTVACGGGAPLSEEGAVALAAAAVAHAPLRELRLRSTGSTLLSQAALHALVGVCASRRGRHLHRLVLDGCTVSEAARADALATLLAAGGKTELII
jgi:hypothetical protein